MFSAKILAPWLALAAAAPATVGARPAPAARPKLAERPRRHPADMLVTNLSSEPESIDPGLCNESNGGVIIDALFAGLLRLDGRTLAPRPELAVRHTVSDDGRIYTFTLRPSRWDDGTAVTAEDFAFAWRRVLDPATGSRVASPLYVLARAEAYHRGALWVQPADGGPGCGAAIVAYLRAHGGGAAAIEDDADRGCTLLPPDDPARAALLALDGAAGPTGPLRVRPVASADVGVVARAPDTLEVRLVGPTPYFPALVAHHLFRPVPRHLLTRLAAAGVPEAHWTRPEHIVTNGPFRLTGWRFKRDLHLQRSASYWDAARVALREVVLLEVESAATALDLYRAGEIDWTGPVLPLPPAFLAALSGYADVARGPMLSCYFYWLNGRAPPLDDVRVRRALALAVDRTLLARTIARGGEVPTASLVPDGLAGYRGLGLPLFDPAAARRELAAAGYGPGHPLPPLTLIYNTHDQHRQIAEAVQAMWRQHLGVDISLASQEWNVYLARLNARDFQIARLGWTGDYPDPNTFLHELLSGEGDNNLGGVPNREVDRLLAAAARTADGNARLALLRAAEAAGMAAQPLVPLFFSTRAYAARASLTGLYPNVMDYHPLADLAFGDDGDGGG